MKKCPYCAEEIQDAAILCRHCGRQLTEATVPAGSSQTTTVTTTSSGTDPGLAAIALTLLGIAAMFVVTPFIVIPGTALWAAWDSSQLQLTKYKSGLSYSPIVLFVVVSLLWIVGFPWYVVVRQQIKRGALPLR